MMIRNLSLSGNAEGAMWALASVLGATAMTLAVRILAADVHTTMLAFLRSALALVTVLPFLWRGPQTRRRVRITAWKLHIARGLLLAMTLNTGFYAIWKLPLATSTILFFLAPVFATVLAIPLLGEQVGPRRWAATAAGFIGTLVILRPGFGGFEPAMIAAVASSMCFAGALMLGRLITDRDGTEGVFVSSSVIVAIATLPPALAHWSIPVEAWQWAAIATLVAGSSMRTYADIRAYAVGDAGFVAPFTYLRLVTVGGAGYILFSEAVDGPTIVGGTIIIASTLYIAIRERQRRGRPRPVQTP
ncbi:DMT family transporter [Limibaculum sp. M0105]|uniref:DMT family transporter n=1 Tax=Thermohalobaculum xanthum TaxID=2753746 RepID=A0A8J7SF88_9RHOB|nr:DMT family transporter [Thermohalobaculum xanthum]MBK0401117.1 DMT family transporter [Thermohalobaculum xanthum]